MCCLLRTITHLRREEKRVWQNGEMMISRGKPLIPWEKWYLHISTCSKYFKNYYHIVHHVSTANLRSLFVKKNPKA
jgi:hypothetical protein